MCTVIINVLEPGAFNLASQYFIPLFNKISWLCEQQPGGDEASNEGCNSVPTVYDFTDNSNHLRDLYKLVFAFREKSVLGRLDLLRELSFFSVQIDDQG
jgi:hypothetical protein